MAFPGIISALHHTPAQALLVRQIEQCVDKRAEALLLASAHAIGLVEIDVAKESTDLVSAKTSPEDETAALNNIAQLLPNACSLYISAENGAPKSHAMRALAPRAHDGKLTTTDLRLNNQQLLPLSQTLGDLGLMPLAACAQFADALAAGHRHFIMPAAVQPVARAILNIWLLDPYLAQHFLTSFTPLLTTASADDYLAVFAARAEPESCNNEWVKCYITLEKKLYRAYLDH
ncbi:MAG: hypothetical protein ACRCYV_01105 [Aeromonas sp.]